MKKVVQAVIFAGGLGTRLKPYTEDNPKAMFPVNGTPFIEKLILQLKAWGIEEIIILLGYLPDIIMNYLGNGEKYGLNIKYDITPVAYETSLRLDHAKPLLKDSFILMYCDNYCPINYQKLVADYYTNKALIQLSVYDNLDNYTKNNIFVTEDGLVTKYDSSRLSANLNGVDIGYMIVNKKILDLLSKDNSSLAKNIFDTLINKKQLFATMIAHRYYSIGSYDRISLTEDFFKPKKVVFLDRDGTLNVKAPKACYIENKEQFVWLDGAKEAVKLLNDKQYIVVLVTNQPGISRGNFTIKVLNDIHQKMQTDLKEIGARIDYIYYCPHNWQDGCNCRKPNPGLFYQAQRELALDLTKCPMFGDDERDMQAAHTANLKVGIQIVDNYPLISAVKDYIRKEEEHDSI
ncbi:MAG TPA: HAD-IIIA family hydrolase [Bacilli bacterium]|nr:HAD-IIIA family hydrolase [Bacilli bacterium]